MMGDQSRDRFLQQRRIDRFPQFEHEGLAAFTQRWKALHAYAGQAGMILDNGKLQHEGLAVGVDDIGRFVLDTPVGRKAIMAGDVSLRPKG